MVSDRQLRRIAFFGGTFDPPHKGHIEVAKAAADSFHLDRVFIVPTGRQPLKQNEHVTPFDNRVAMVALASEADPRFAVSTIDAPHPDGSPNYTVDTLTALRREMPEAALFCISGADSFLSLRQWREPDRLLEMAEWIVVSRPESPLRDLSVLHLTPQQRERVHLLETVHEEVSATEVRRRLHAGESCTDLIPAAVIGYIQERRLYR
jgi:nicotinate-nucleotide adenylyltransferase